MSVNQVQPTTQCSFCIFLVKTLEDLLPKERTEVSHTRAVKQHMHTNKHNYLFVLPPHADRHTRKTTPEQSPDIADARSPSSPFPLQGAVIKLLEEICHILPSAYRDQCQVVIGKFSKSVLDALLTYATPQTICAVIGLCKGQEAPVVGQSASPGHFFLSRNQQMVTD